MLQILSLAASLQLFGLSVPAQDDSPTPQNSQPAKPLWERLLQGDDAKTAADLGRKINQFSVAGKFAQAAAAAAQLAALRVRVQGKDHWQVRDAFRRSKDFAAWSQLPKDERRMLMEIPTLIQQVEVLKKTGKYREAIPLQQQIFEIHRKFLGEEHRDTAMSYYHVAEILDRLGKYEKAAESFQKALDICRKVNGKMHPDTAHCFSGVAFSLSRLGRYTEAAEGYQQSLNLRRKLLGDEHPDTAASYNNVAAMHNRQGRYAEAAEGYQKALNVWRKTYGEDHTVTASGFTNMGGILGTQGRYAEAAEMLQKALMIRLNVFGQEHDATARSYNNLAGMMNRQGKYAEALQLQQTALGIRQRVLGPDHPITAGSYLSIAAIFHARGNFAKAAENHENALEIYRNKLDENHPKTAHAYNATAQNLSAMGDFAAAVEGHRKAIDIFRRTLGENHPDTAGGYYDLAAALEKQGDYGKAIEAYQQALHIYREAVGEEHRETAFAYSSLAGSLEALGRYAEAEAALETAVSIFEKRRRWTARKGVDRAVAGSRIGTEAAYAAILARNGKTELAAQILEQSLGRGLLDELAGRQRAIPLQERRRRIDLVSRTNALDRLVEGHKSNPGPETQQILKRLNGERLALKMELSELARHWDESYSMANGKPLSLKQIQNALPVDTALVAWLDKAPFGPRWADPNGEHWAFLLRSTGPPLMVRLSGSGENAVWTDLDYEMPEKLRVMLRNARSKVSSRLLEAMTRNRFAPLQPHLEPSGDLPAVRHLVVLPSHFIAGLPVELFAPQGIRISYAPSGSLLTYLRQLPKPKSAGVLAVGDPVFRQRKPKDETEPHAMRDQRELGRWLAALRSGAETFAPLPGTFVEVKRIQALFQSTQQPHEVFVRTQASEPKLVELARGGRLKQYRYLHFATHGVINDQRPTRSALILSQVGLPNPAEQFDKGLPIFDSRLTVEEITEQWELNADLVTLSACETALGRYTRGEGHIGFAQALLAAGARSVVLSLWKVDDTAATLLMDRFYTNLLGRRDGLSAPMPKAEALTEAKTWLRDLSKPQASKLVAQVHTDLERGKGRVERPAPAINPSQPSEKRRGLSGDRPFAHPYYWAAFILIGDPN